MLVARNQYEGGPDAAHKAGRPQGWPHKVSALPAGAGQEAHEASAHMGSRYKVPEFARKAERQGKLLRGRPEEKDATDFIEATFGWPQA